MSFRTRLFLAILLAVWLPLGALSWRVSRELDRRLTAEYDGKVGAVASIIENDLARESGTVATRLSTLATEVGRDNRVRLAVLQADQQSRQYLLDYAGRAMRLAGLSMLQLEDSTGRILSSGHFRNQFDRLEPELPRLLASMRDTLVLVRARTPDSTLVALTRMDSLRVGGKPLYLIGGIEAAHRLLSGLTHDHDLAVALRYPGTPEAQLAGGRVLRSVALPYVDVSTGSAAGLDTARLVVIQSLGTLESLRHGITRWFALALGLTLAGTFLVALWLSVVVSRPLRALGDTTSRVVLDRLDQSFDTNRTDEIGALSRLLGAMTERLRSSTTRLREVERRAAIGDLARQVNHDIKNGLTPIRNVLRHLTQASQQEPQRLADIFEARRGTLESSVEYLDTLARNYDRLSPSLERRPCDVNAIVEQVLRSTTHDGVVVQRQLQDRLPHVVGDELMVRRILENLVGNAIDSTAGRAGASVTVTTEPVEPAGEPPRVRIIVADTGSGMTQADLQRAFDDFYSTKP